MGRLHWSGRSDLSALPLHHGRQHQTLDGKGYLYAAGKYSVQVIDCRTGKLVGEFGSYGNMDCQGKGSKYPHPELPFGMISALSVWKDRLFAVDVTESADRKMSHCVRTKGNGRNSRRTMRQPWSDGIGHLSRLPAFFSLEEYREVELATLTKEDQR